MVTFYLDNSRLSTINLYFSQFRAIAQKTESRIIEIVDFSEGLCFIATIRIFAGKLGNRQMP